MDMKFKDEELLELTTQSGGRFKAESLGEAEFFCRELALSHYENFPVGSLIIPKQRRKHFYSIYAFARIADDIADELISLDKETRIKALDDFDFLLHDNYFSSGVSGNPIFIALQQTFAEKDIPRQPLRALLLAFKRDIYFAKAEHFAELEDYCQYSANPVGELILRLFDECNDVTKGLSDKICAGLQLINFWQDISVDIEKGRVYIPNDILQKYGIKFDKHFIEQIDNGNNAAKLLQCLDEIYDITERYINEGSDLINHLNSFRLRAEIAITVEGGKKMLNMVRKMGCNIIKARPKLNKIHYIAILLRAFFLNRVLF